jgi:trehalose 6-phosphate phosphatase
VKTNGNHLPHLFLDWPRIAAKLNAHPCAVIFLDFDGTLVNIERRPHQVKLLPETRSILKRMSRNERLRVVIISGRRREDIQHLIGLENVDYLGLYGWEKGSAVHLSLEEQIDLVRARVTLGEKLADVPGVWLEPKSLSLSVHVREARPRDKKKIQRAVRNVLRAFQKTLRLQENIRDFEVMPRSACNKGDAVRRCLANGVKRGTLPFFFGDDYSDESAFAAASSGIPVLVGAPRPTRAKFRLRGPAEVTEALYRLEDALE